VIRFKTKCDFGIFK